MEHKFYTDDLERLLKEKSDEFRMYPSKRVWHSIYNDLHPDRKWPSIAVTLVLVTVLFLIGYWNNGNNTENAAAGKSQSNKQIATYTTANNHTTLSGNVGNTYQQATDNSRVNTHITTSDNALQKNKQQTAATQGTENAAAKNTTAFMATGTAINAKKQQRLANVTNNKKSINRFNGFSNSKISAAHQAKDEINKYNSGAASKIEQKEITAGVNIAGAEYQTALDYTTNELIAATTSYNKTTAATDNTVTLQQLHQNAEQPATAKKESVKQNKLSAQDKSWVEHYALYNKPSRKKWKGRLSSEVYLTPGVTLRSFHSNTSVKVSSVPSVVNMPGAKTEVPGYNPGLSFQTGAGLSYAASKSIRLKAGIQASFTSYTIPVTDINHPVLTTLTLNNLNSGYPYLESRPSTIANVPGHNNKKIHNQTSQISIPVGIALKLAGNNKLEWYAGGGIQPAFIMGGKAYLVSSDNNNFVSESSMLRKWNINGTAETYIHYKMNGFTLQAGPEFRYQFMSTYSGRYSYSEKLYNVGIKLGIVKNL